LARKCRKTLDLYESAIFSKISWERVLRPEFGNF
jgi:hypothetical protein